MVVAAFQLPYENLPKAALIKHLESFLKDCTRAGKRVLLVVDEAQNLPARSLEELRMLSNFQVSEMPLIQSFLLGQAEFRETLQAPGMEQLRQRVIASCHLNPLTAEETRAYIEHRLRVVGWQAQPHFSEEAYAAIYKHTQGVPRRINVFCDRLLLYGFLEDLQALSDVAVAAVARELSHEVTSSIDVATSKPVWSGSPPGDETARRLKELERSMVVIQRALFAVSKTLDSDAEGQRERMGKLEQRVVELESALREFRWNTRRLAER
jgi:general secretion pathway protein A